jgi:hypothetical protein
MHEHGENENPFERPEEPDHPMILDGCVTSGDTLFMVRCLLEEMLMAGLPPAQLAEMARTPNYQALYAARLTLGAEVFDRILEETAGRIGTHRFTTREACPDSPYLTIGRFDG